MDCWRFRAIGSAGVVQRQEWKKAAVQAAASGDSSSRAEPIAEMEERVDGPEPRKSGGRLKCKRPPKGPFDTHTASLAALTGRARTIFRAGLALNIISSPVKGLVPLRALVAGFLMTTNFAKPGTRKTPFFFSSL